jgi:hypothetical protein
MDGGLRQAIRNWNARSRGNLRVDRFRTPPVLGGTRMQLVLAARNTEHWTPWRNQCRATAGRRVLCATRERPACAWPSQSTNQRRRRALFPVVRRGRGGVDSAQDPTRPRAGLPAPTNGALRAPRGGASRAQGKRRVTRPCVDISAAKDHPDAARADRDTLVFGPPTRFAPAGHLRGAGSPVQRKSAVPQRTVGHPPSTSTPPEWAIELPDAACAWSFASAAGLAAGRARSANSPPGQDGWMGASVDPIGVTSGG